MVTCVALLARQSNTFPAEKPKHWCTNARVLLPSSPLMHLQGPNCGKTIVSMDAGLPANTSSSEPPAPAPMAAPMDKLAVVRRMRALSQRGRLPGFEETADGFKALAYGWVFDFDLAFRIDESPDGCTLTPALVLKRRMPAIVLALLAFSIWPGVWITDSMLSTYFTWYPHEFWKTCVWYLPITILPMPWVWKTAIGRSRLLAEESARELADRVRSELNAGSPAT